MIHTFNETFLYGGCSGNNCVFTFFIWVTTYLGCDGQWINNGTHCINNCTTTQYFDFNTNTCKPCDPKCLTCYDANSCSSCFASQKRVLSNVSCVPIDGYYDSGSLVAVLCDSSCLTCTGSATTCTSCHNTSLLVGSSCGACN